MFAMSPLNRTTRRAIGAAVVVTAVIVGLLAVTRVASSDEPDVGRTPRGQRFGQLHAAYVAPDEVVFDAMVLSSGDGDDGAYTLRNPSTATVAIPVAPSVSVTVVRCEASCTEGHPLDYAALTRRLEGDAGRTMYFSLTIDEGVVVRIDETYLA